MAVAYFDSSALVKLVVDEPGSDVAARLWDEADTVASNRLAHPEVTAALSAATRGGRLSPTESRRALKDWRQFWAATRVVELTEPIADAAGALVTRFVLGGADAVHLASVLALADADPLMVAWDVRLRTAADEAGLVVAPARSQSWSEPG